MKIINATLLDRFRGERLCCEWCKKVKYCVASHIYTRGAGRVDIEENLLSLCGECEWSHHSPGGHPTVEEMKLIVALRMGITPESIKDAVDAARLLPQPKDSTPKPLKKKPKKAKSAWEKLAAETRKKMRKPNKGLS